jgi:D-alanyl-D-alanine carboxypeptidase
MAGRAGVRQGSFPYPARGLSTRVLRFPGRHAGVMTDHTHSPQHSGSSRRQSRAPGRNRRSTARIVALTAGAGALAISALAASSASAAPASTTRQVSSRYGQSQLKHDVDALVAAGATGVVAEVNDGQLVATAGRAELGSSRPVPDDSYIRIGSATKPFVATVILQLAAEHRLSLSDTVTQWLPGVVSGNGNDGHDITIKELLQHTSGIYDFVDSLPQVQSKQGYLAYRFRSATPGQLVAIAMQHKPLFKPGTSWAYSNTDYVLLGMIIKKATGRDWTQEVYERIIRPLGLRHTFTPGSSPYLPAPHANAYEQYISGGPLTDTTTMNYTWADASGEIVSTPDDLDRFFRALVIGRLLPPAQLAEMETTVATQGEDGLLDRYGLGLAWQPLSCGGGYWTHGGDVVGSATYDGVTAGGRRSAVVEVFTELAGEAGLREHQLEERLVDHALCAG